MIKRGRPSRGSILKGKSNNETVAPTIIITTRVKADLVGRVKAILAKQIHNAKQIHDVARAVTDTILPGSGLGTRDRIIVLLSQPLVEPYTMEAVREWQGMVADQILAVVNYKLVKCEICGNEFKTSQGLGMHKRLKHKGKAIKNGTSSHKWTPGNR